MMICKADFEDLFPEIFPAERGQPARPPEAREGAPSGEREEAAPVAASARRQAADGCDALAA
ncbi:hypothetical protein [Pararhodobacter oceanensis]|uniref:hypothetical protein n=1 Tax=Pararhodobacter oceanensis TaxID=2172121 RepID=UPI003A8EC774